MKGHAKGFLSSVLPVIGCDDVKLKFSSTADRLEEEGEPNPSCTTVSTHPCTPTGPPLRTWPQFKPSLDN